MSLVVKVFDLKLKYWINKKTDLTMGARGEVTRITKVSMINFVNNEGLYKISWQSILNLNKIF